MISKLCGFQKLLGSSHRSNLKEVNKSLVSKETVVLRRWERSKQKFGFIKGVDKGEITTVKDLQENLHRRNREETGGPLPRTPTRRRAKQHRCVQTSRASFQSS